MTMNDSHSNEDNSEMMKMDTVTDENEEEFMEEKDRMKQKVPAEKEGNGTTDEAKEETAQIVTEYDRRRRTKQSGAGSRTNRHQRCRSRSQSRQKDRRRRQTEQTEAETDRPREEAVRGL